MSARVQEHPRQHEDIHTLPWFGAVKGFALVPPEGSINEDDDPVAIIVLTEGGQLMVHDLANMQPVPLSLPFQELPAVTVSAIIPASLPEDAPGCSLHGVTLARLRVMIKTQLLTWHINLWSPLQSLIDCLSAVKTSAGLPSHLHKEVQELHLPGTCGWQVQ